MFEPAKREIKPGTPCLVVGYNYHDKNLGKRVVANTFFQPGEKRNVPGIGNVFFSPDAKASAWLVTGEDLVRTIRKNGEWVQQTGQTFTFAQAKHLLPIPPDEHLSSESQSAETPLKAEH